VFEGHGYPLVVYNKPETFLSIAKMKISYTYISVSIL
jgi:hypothetical protein